MSKGDRIRLNRREFLLGSLAAGWSASRGWGATQGGRRMGFRRIDPANIPPYAYRVLSTDRFPGLQREFEALLADSRLSRQKPFRDQIVPLSARIPEDFREARSAVVVAVHVKPMIAGFAHDGKTDSVLIPPQYYEQDPDPAALMAIVEKEIIKDAGRRIVDVTDRVPLKLLAARSGLGRYGRNNLIFVNGMGSYNLLSVFLTDHRFPDAVYSWAELEILDACRRCHICDRICPSQAISRGSSLLDAGRCITLFNEIEGKFPSWALPSFHHALMGCLKCQSPCPENAGIADLTGTLDVVTGDETSKILQNRPDQALTASLRNKLRGFPAATMAKFPILSRNLNALIRN